MFAIFYISGPMRWVDIAPPEGYHAFFLNYLSFIIIGGQVGWVDIAPPEGNYFLLSAAAANWEIK